MKFFEKFEGLIYFTLSMTLLGFSAYGMMGAIANHLWELIGLLFFLFLLGITLALYSYSRWLLVRHKKNYLKIYHYYLKIQVLSFFYLTGLGCYFTFYLHDSNGKLILIAGIFAVIIAIIPLYFATRDDQKKDL